MSLYNGGITINENGVLDVVCDLVFALKRTYPDRKEFKYFEGNSADHLKSSIIVASETHLIEDRKLILGN